MTEHTGLYLCGLALAVFVALLFPVWSNPMPAQDAKLAAHMAGFNAGLRAAQRAPGVDLVDWRRRTCPK